MAGVNDALDRATTSHITSGGVEDRGNIAQTLSMPHEAPLLEGHTSRSVKGSIDLTELMDLCIASSNKVDSLSAELAQTKQAHAQELSSLQSRVSSLEKALAESRRRRSDFFADDDDVLMDSSKQGRSQDEEEFNVDDVEHGTIEIMTKVQTTTIGVSPFMDSPIKQSTPQQQVQKETSSEEKMLSAAQILLEVAKGAGSSSTGYTRTRRRKSHLATCTKTLSEEKDDERQVFCAKEKNLIRSGRSKSIQNAT